VDINATLLGQMITFTLFVVITMKWIWPLFKKVLDERAKKIADGLAAAAKGHRDLEIAEHKSNDIVQNAKQQAAKILEESNHRAHTIVELSKEQARVEAERIVAHAQVEVQQNAQTAREQLRREVVQLAILGAEKILKRQINAQDAEKLLADVPGEL
jgi:F-type H+-transporting ATPase subunit b